MDISAQLRQEYLSLGGVAGALAILAGLSEWRGHALRAEVLLGVSAALLAGGVVSRGFRAGFYRRWARVSAAIAEANTTLALAILFFAGFGFYRCCGRMVGRDPLSRRCGRRDSYWIPRQRTRQRPWQFERLY